MVRFFDPYMAKMPGTVKALKASNPPRVVVWQADPLIWLDAGLLAECRNPNRKRITGDTDIDGDLVSFGTPGEGLGRVTYRINEYGPVYHLAERIDQRDSKSDNQPEQETEIAP